jgi:hypothetical protein
MAAGQIGRSGGTNRPQLRGQAQHDFEVGGMKNIMSLEDERHHIGIDDSLIALLLGRLLTDANYDSGKGIAVEYD